MESQRTRLSEDGVAALLLRQCLAPPLTRDLRADGEIANKKTGPVFHWACAKFGSGCIRVMSEEPNPIIENASCRNTEVT
jgi:hypothetical protein